MQQYISDFKAPRTPAPQLPSTKGREKGKGKDNDTRETKGGKEGKKPQLPSRRLSRLQEESIEKGETIESDWESFADGEDRLRRECEENEEKFYPEDDWAIAERQADDVRRAQDKAKYRKEASKYP